MRRFLAADEFRSVLRLAAPIALLQTGMVLFGTVATLLAGRLGPDAIAVVGLSNSSFFFLFITCMGLLLGIDPLSAKAFGAGRPGDCAEVLIHALVLVGFLVCPVFCLLSFSGTFFSWLGIEPRLAAGAAAYLRILRWALVPGLLFAACRQFLQTMNVTRPQLLAVLAGNLVNMALGYSLMFGVWGAPRLGIAGAAYALVSGNAVMGLVVGVVAIARVRRCGFSWRGLKPVLLAELARLGFPAALQMLAEVGAFSCATMLCGRMGSVPAAAHQIALNLASLSYMVPLGVSHAAAVRVGQGLGQGRPDSSVRSGWSALAIGVAFMSFASLAYLSLPRLILGFYTDDAAVLGLGTTLLGIIAFFQVADGTQVVMSGALRGLGETRVPMAANAIGYWLLGLPVGAWLALRRGWGALGVWSGLCLGLIFVSLSLLLAWRARAKTIQNIG
jgi:MATE family multidrug resistance protein